MPTLPPYDKIKQFFPYHRKELVKTLLLLLQCISISGTVCLYKNCNSAGHATGNSKLPKARVYKTLIRFFCMKCTDAFCLGLIYLIINVLSLDNCIFIVMDRTNWKIGKTNINILYIGLLLPNGSFIPILFDVLDKRGNSSSTERKCILGRFCELWQQNGQQKPVLLADREFVGIEWFKCIVNAGFSLVIRIRSKDYFNELCRQQNTQIDEMRAEIAKKVSNQGYFSAPILLDECHFYYVALPNSAPQNLETDEPYLFFITDNPDAQAAGEQYRKRWKIEVFFFNIKTNGFNVENINFKNPKKIQLMLAILAFLYAIIQKKHLDNPPNIKDKIFKHNTTKSISIFRSSYDNFKLKVLTINHLLKYINQILRHFIPPNQHAFRHCEYIYKKNG